MIYRRDNDKKFFSDKNLLILFIVVALTLLFLVAVPQSAKSIASALSSVFAVIAGPDSVPVKNIESFKAVLSDKETLIKKNLALEAKLGENETRIKEIEAIESENFSLKEILGRKKSADLIIARVMLRPNRSPYDTLLVDAGENAGVRTGSNVFALGDTLIGTVEAVYKDASLVSLFSTPGREFEARLGGEDISIKLTGRGGGSFEAVIPRAVLVSQGDSVVIPSLSRSVIGYVEATVSDPRDPFVKLFILSPVSFSTLRFVEIEK